MKRVFFLIFSVLTSFSSQSIENLEFPIEPLMAKEWKFQSDQVMGGVSQGDASLVQDGDMFFFRLTGDVSTRNNGGFVQFRSKVSLFNKPEMFQLIHNANKVGQELEGVRLMVRGNGERYHVMIRTYSTWSPSDYYYHTFDTSIDWQQVDLPFSEFRRSKSGEMDLGADQMRDFAVVAYGRDFKSDVSVSNISFYY
ncbi:CIA30 family protein [Candidatus Thioglobus sp.]|nr:CIA30 family protein [Candidatus Thioglobus sp.]